MSDQDVGPAKVRWSRLPTRWIFGWRLAAFRGGASLGRSMAALKIYVAIVLNAENKAPAIAGPHQGSAQLSYSEFEELTDLSRPMISSALKLLREDGLIVTEDSGRRGRRRRYWLSDYGAADHWVKIPNARLYRSNQQGRIGVLCDLSCRREADLNALKLYLALAALRGKDSLHAMASYSRIWIMTGIRRERIRRAISVLIDHNLIVVSHQKIEGLKRNTPNVYQVLGL